MGLGSEASDYTSGYFGWPKPDEPKKTPFSDIPVEEHRGIYVLDPETSIAATLEVFKSIKSLGGEEFELDVDTKVREFRRQLTQEALAMATHLHQTPKHPLIPFLPLPSPIRNEELLLAIAKQSKHGSVDEEYSGVYEGDPTRLPIKLSGCRLSGYKRELTKPGVFSLIESDCNPSTIDTLEMQHRFLSRPRREHPYIKLASVLATAVLGNLHDGRPNQNSETITRRIVKPATSGLIAVDAVIYTGGHFNFTASSEPRDNYPLRKSLILQAP